MNKIRTHISQNSRNVSDLDSTSLSMIDCGIKSLNDLPLKHSLTSINLHSNSILKIENLLYLQNLLHLDLSSNRLSKIQGLSGLVSLKSLNLSCNLIVTIENLECLKHLNYLNLSYNKIQNVSGLNDMWGRDYSLETLILNSNFINSIEEISYYLSGLLRLKHLTLNDNKLPRTIDYKPIMWSNIKSLTSLDGKDRSNKKISLRAKSPIVLNDDLQQFNDFEPADTLNMVNATSKRNSLARKLSLTDESEQYEEDSSSMSSFGPKLDKIEDKIHKLLKIREKIKSDLDLSDEEARSDGESYRIKSKTKAKKIVPKSILKSPSKSNLSLNSDLDIIQQSPPNNSVGIKDNGHSNFQEVIKILEDQLNSYKKAQEENVRLIQDLKHSLESKSESKENKLKEKDEELDKEKELNKLLIKELDECKKKLEASEQKLKHYETKTLKHFTKNEQKLISAHLNEIQNLRFKHETESKEKQEKIAQLELKYKDLEDEFRSALLIESSRFNDLFEKYEAQSQEFSSIKTSLRLSEQNEARNKSLINELNTLIKEQKSRIQQLSKLRQDSSEDVQKRNLKLNEAVNDCLKLKAQCEEVKKERKSLEITLKKLASELDAIKKDRETWSQKLNDQKTFFMQENARLEIENKQMRNEIELLNANYVKESDQCKIKSKVIEDQTETIKKLKAGLVERDEMLKKSRDEALNTQKSLEKQLNLEMDLTNELQMKLEKSSERKDALKSELEKYRTSLDETKFAYDELINKWKQKSELITELEVKVKKMKENFEQKEREMDEKCAKLSDENHELQAKLRKIDDNFRLQYDAEKKEHLLQSEKVKHEYESKLAEADQKLKELEDEMRAVLLESENKKKFYEEKINNFSKLFSNFQAEIKQDR